MNRKQKYTFQRILVLLVVWILFAILIATREILFLDNFPGIFESGILQDYTFRKTLISGLISSTLGALSIGFLEEVYFRNRLKKLSFGRILFIKILIYSILLIFLTILGSFVFNGLASGRSFFDDVVLSNTLDYIRGGGFFNTIIILFNAVVLTIVFLQINDKFGPGVLWKFLTGRYHDTVEENRAFMFLDIKSSTVIAEQLGHSLYFKMLNDFFADITDPILENNGEIYQYVGDEVVITWTEKDFESIYTCFLQIKLEIDKRSEYYKINYGLAPEFKAGVHSGRVTVGEVGVIKREIVYTGDVLNTAARIQSLCNQNQTDMLVSQSVFSHISNKTDFDEIGQIQLRGRNEKVFLYKRRN